MLKKVRASAQRIARSKDAQACNWSRFPPLSNGFKTKKLFHLYDFQLPWQNNSGPARLERKSQAVGQWKTKTWGSRIWSEGRIVVLKFWPASSLMSVCRTTPRRSVPGSVRDSLGKEVALIRRFKNQHLENVQEYNLANPWVMASLTAMSLSGS